LHLAITDPEVEKVEVTGLGRPVTLGRSGHHESLVSEARTTLELSYVVTYSGNVKAGARPIPVKVSFDLM
jgi:hypothetical protein